MRDYGEDRPGYFPTLRSLTSYEVLAYQVVQNHPGAFYFGMHHHVQCYLRM